MNVFSYKIFEYINLYQALFAESQIFVQAVKTYPFLVHDNDLHIFHVNEGVSIYNQVISKELVEIQVSIKDYR